MFDKNKLLAFLEEGSGAGGGGSAGGDAEKKKKSTALRHCQSILTSAMKDAESGRALDLSEARLPGIPKWAREEIPKRFALMTTTVAPEDCITSRDGNTTKMIVELQDGHRVESVVMRHERGRVTLCVSSQVGCKMGCTFCATGTLGELGNLTCGEILEQLVHAQRRGQRGTGRGGGGGGRGEKHPTHPFQYESSSDGARWVGGEREDETTNKTRYFVEAARAVKCDVRRVC